jgi:hypothetical protein
VSPFNVIVRRINVQPTLIQVAHAVNKFPTGVMPAGIRITVMGVQEQVVPAAPYQAIFDLEAGTYDAVAQSVDANGSALGEALKTTFTVEDGVSVDVPVSIQIGL